MKNWFDSDHLESSFFLLILNWLLVYIDATARWAVSLLGVSHCTTESNNSAWEKSYSHAKKWAEVFLFDSYYLTSFWSHKKFNIFLVFGRMSFNNNNKHQQFSVECRLITTARTSTSKSFHSHESDASFHPLCPYCSWMSCFLLRVLLITLGTIDRSAR